MLLRRASKILLGCRHAGIRCFRVSLLRKEMVHLTQSIRSGRERSSRIDQYRWSSVRRLVSTCRITKPAKMKGARVVCMMVGVSVGGWETVAWDAGSRVPGRGSSLYDGWPSTSDAPLHAYSRVACRRSLVNRRFPCRPLSPEKPAADSDYIKDMPHDPETNFKRVKVVKLNNHSVHGADMHAGK